MRKHTILSFRALTWIWAALVSLTFVTVAVAWTDLGEWNIVLAVFIAAIKSSLVVLFFMHVKFETRLIQGLVLLAIFVTAVIFILTFSDYPFRG